MTGGIHIKPGTKATINGIEVERCVELAVSVAQLGVQAADGLPAQYASVATRAARRLNKMRQRGYSWDICRDALWATVIDEAQRLSAQPADKLVSMAKRGDDIEALRLALAEVRGREQAATVRHELLAGDPIEAKSDPDPED